MRLINKQVVNSGIPYLTEQSLTTSSSRCWVVDVNVMVLSWDRLLHKWLVEHNTIHFHMVFWLHQFMIYKTEYFSYNQLYSKDLISEGTRAPTLCKKHTPCCIHLHKELFLMPPAKRYFHFTFLKIAISLTNQHKSLSFMLEGCEEEKKERKKLYHQSESSGMKETVIYHRLMLDLLLYAWHWRQLQRMAKKCSQTHHKSRHLTPSHEMPAIWESRQTLWSHTQLVERWWNVFLMKQDF